MRKTTLRRLLALTASTGFTVALAACGPDDAQQGQAQAALMSPSAPDTGWSMSDLAGVDPAFLGGDAAPLPQAMPMRASFRGDYDYAPAYDYGPEPYYDDGYYDDGAGPDDYQWLALASALGGMFGSAPPDYGFGYDGIEPWAWESGDRYLRYAEPVYGGYRYYYYAPDAYAPFLVSDPYYSYGYRGDQLVVIYDRSGRVLDARRAERQRQAARDYYARARELYRAAQRERHIGVPAPLWDRHRDEIARKQRQWDQARFQTAAWRKWDAANQPKLHREWAGEALVRREAENRFAGWRKADFKTPPPKLYTPQQRQVQLQKVAQIRRDEQQAGQRRAAQRQQQQGLASAERARQHDAQQQRQRAQAQEADLQRLQGHQRQAEAQHLRVRRHNVQQQRAQAERDDAQRMAKVQPQAHAAAVTRERAAREHRLEAQRAQQARVAQQREQARQSRVAQQQKQAQQARAAEHQKEVRKARAARQAQQARAAQQRQTEQARAAQQQKQAQQARAAQQKQQAHARAAAAQQRSGQKPQAAAQAGDGGHHRGHGRG